MTYAIIRIKDQQLRVKLGDRITINGLIGHENDNIELGEILLVKNGTIEVGKPTLTGKVGLRVLKHIKSEKVVISTYKAKSRYRKTRGHRQSQTVLEVLAVGKSEAKTKPKSTATKKVDGLKSVTDKVAKVRAVKK